VSAEAVQAPLGVDQGLDLLVFQFAGGFEIGEETLAEFHEGFHVFAGEDYDLGHEAMPEGVQAGALFAFFGARTGGELGILVVCDDLRNRGWHNPEWQAAILPRLGKTASCLFG
jgi:hypothetical protein